MIAATANLEPGQPFPDLDLPDHTHRPRRLSELAGGDRWRCCSRAVGGARRSSVTCAR